MPLDANLLPTPCVSVQRDGMACVDGLSEGQCDGADDVCTSPTAVNNPEYFDEHLLASTADQQQCGMAGLEVRPGRLRSQSTESTASDHDEYDQLNCSCSQHAGTPQPGRVLQRSHDCDVPPRAVMIDIATAQQMFAESVL